MKQQSVESYFKELPDGYRELALASMNKDGNSIIDSMEGAIMEGIHWRYAYPQGDFWSEVHKYYRDKILGVKLPPLPAPTTMKKKTNIGFLNKLPRGYRERALRAYWKNKGHIEIVDDLLSAINDFIWSRTPEKAEFWLAVYNHYVDINNPLPPLPNNTIV